MIDSEPAERPDSPSEEKPSGERLRLFIALPLPKEILVRIAELQENLKKGFHFTGCRPTWVSPETIHLTLRFLGASELSKAGPLAERLEEIAARHGPITLKAQGLGVFPHWRRPRVLWAGLSEVGDRLPSLQGEIEALGVELGYEPSANPFSPHLTLARFRSLKGTAVARGIVQSHSHFGTDSFTLSKLVLYRSDLRREGAQHAAVCGFMLTSVIPS